MATPTRDPQHPAAQRVVPADPAGEARALTRGLRNALLVIVGLVLLGWMFVAPPETGAPAPSPTPVGEADDAIDSTNG